MGVAIGDFDADGNLDIFKTHFRGDTSVLYRGNGKGAFRDITIRAGLGVETRFVGWGAGIVDLDNDGLPDLSSPPGWSIPKCEQKFPEPVQNARRDLPQSRRRQIRRAARRGRTRHRRAALQPRGRVRRLRQRRRPRHPDRQHERAADTAAQRRPPAQPLAQGAAHRHDVEPQRHRRPSRRDATASSRRRRR